jgi:Tfp pilus assembly protein PilE
MRNPSQVEVPQSALPIVALVFAIVGLCLPLLLPVGVVLAIISLVRSEQPAYARRKTLSIVVLALSLMWLPMVGIMAAIAIPNFVRFQSRSKQAECKTNLKSALTAERACWAENDRYSTDPAEVGFRPEPRNRYLYRFAAAGPLEEVGIPADRAVTKTSSDQLEAQLPAQLRAVPGLRGRCPDCSLTVLCAGNVDNDPELDVWSVSTAPRHSASGAEVPAGTLFHHFDDVNDEAEALADDEGDAQPAAAQTGAAPSTPEHEGDDNSWVSYSGDGLTTLRQRSAQGQCSLECSKDGGQVLWTSSGKCIAGPGERRFVAPDCERTVVLVPAPNRGGDWAQTNVMRVYARGALAYAVSGAAVLPEKYMLRSPSWVKGCFGVPGDEPHYSADGLAVEYTMIDGKDGRVSLVADPKPTDAATQKRPKRP